MIILIGGTGFIGKHVCCAIEKSGKKAVCFSPHPDFDFIQQNCHQIDAFTIDQLFTTQSLSIIDQAEAVVYLASNSYPAMQGNSPSLELKTNVGPAIKTLDHIASINPKVRHIYLSSGGTIYGSGHTSPIVEGTPSNPTTPYAFGKATVEQYLRCQANAKKIEYTILRASNPVGKWHINPKQGFIGASIYSIRNNLPISIYGDGRNVRDYIDADELADAILMCIEKLDDSKNQTFNVGSNVGSTLNDIVSGLRQVSNLELEVRHLPARGEDIAYNVLDCSKIAETLGWSAKLGLQDILTRTWISYG